MASFLKVVESFKPHEIWLTLLYAGAVPSLLWIAIGLIAKRFNEKKLKALLFAISGLVYSLLGIFLNRFVESIYLQILFRDFVLTIASFMLVKAVFTVSQVGKIWKFTAYGSLITLLLSEVVLTFVLNLKTVEIFIHLRKFLILLAIFPVIWALTEFIPQRKLRNSLRFFFFILLSAVGILWELDKVQFDISAFLGLALIISATLVYIWFSLQGYLYIYGFLKKVFENEDDALAVSEYTNKLLLLGLLYIYYLSGVQFLNLGGVVFYLQNWTLIETNLVNISLYNLFVAIYLFFVLYYLIGILKKAVKLFFPPQEREDKGGSLEAVIYNVGVLFAVVISISSLGLSWQVILPVAGALGIGLGFGLQTILNNYVSGFILLFSRVVKVGDFVELPGNAGKFINNPNETIFGRVENISILTTQIRTLDGIDILVPNSTFIGNQVINYSLRNPYVRVRFPFAVAYSSDPRQVKEILLKLAYDCPWAKNFYRPPQVWFKEMGDSALIFELMFWVDIREIWRNPYATISHSLIDWVYTNGWYRLKEANIEIPFPQQDIWFRNNLKVVIEKPKGEV